MTHDWDHTAIDGVKDMETHNENLALVIQALSEYYSQKIIIKNGVKVVC